MTAAEFKNVIAVSPNEIVLEDAGILDRPLGRESAPKPRWRAVAICQQCQQNECANAAYLLQRKALEDTSVAITEVVNINTQNIT